MATDKANNAERDPRRRVHLERQWFAQALERCLAGRDLPALRACVAELRDALRRAGETPDPPAGPTVAFRLEDLLDELDQVLQARTLARARYYLRRLRRATEEVRTGPINEINLLRWKEYDDILTDSLWVIPRRDTSGAHQAWYWGNFVPQIPRQMMLRYTRRGDWVLDPFAGSGTTLIECRRLGRNGIGVELNPQVAARARETVAQEPNPQGVVTALVEGDSTTLDFAHLLERHGRSSVHLLLLHPPYHDIIRFGEDPRDLSNAPTVEAFLERLGQVVERTSPVLETGRYLAVVIGDKYGHGEWIPLGFYAMEEVRRRGYRLKSIVVKNFEDTRSKRRRQSLWRYRALAGGFYLFKHEYILIFEKV